MTVMSLVSGSESIIIALGSLVGLALVVCIVLSVVFSLLSGKLRMSVKTVFSLIVGLLLLSWCGAEPGMLLFESLIDLG